jgi:hypothetical protein
MLIGILASNAMSCTVRECASAAAALTNHSSTRRSAAECEKMCSNGAGVAMSEAMMSSSADVPMASDPASVASKDNDGAVVSA